jgi:hypothetical protein
MAEGRKKSTKNRSRLGYGNDIPPLRTHVEIYFNQKERTVKDAQAFFAFCEGRGWGSIKDWKQAAFRWFLENR